jgi:hypothetical protein
MKPLPAYLQKHHAAQDAGHFTPYHTLETMKTKHYSPIITNARQGRPLSTANHKHRNPWPLILAGCLVFWALVAAAFLA